MRLCDKVGTKAPDIAKFLVERQWLKKLPISEKHFTLLTGKQLLCTARECPFNQDFACIDPRVEAIVKENEKIPTTVS